MSITDAVKDLQLELESGEEADEALKYISSEYELNPLLVARKFHEQYRAPHNEWVPSVPPPARPRIDYKSLTPKEVAEEWSKHFHYPMGEAVKIGKVFDFFGDEYLFVSFRRDFDTGYIKAVDPKDGGRKRLRWRLTFGEVDPILSQIYGQK